MEGGMDGGREGGMDAGRPGPASTEPRSRRAEAQGGPQPLPQRAAAPRPERGLEEIKGKNRKFFAQKMGRYWERLPRKVGDAPALGGIRSPWLELDIFDF